MFSKLVSEILFFLEVINTKLLSVMHKFILYSTAYRGANGSHILQQRRKSVHEYWCRSHSISGQNVLLLNNKIITGLFYNWCCSYHVVHWLLESRAFGLRVPWNNTSFNKERISDMNRGDVLLDFHTA